MGEHAMKAQDLKMLAIEWMRNEYPGAVIVPEMSLADWGGASIDLAAITETEIIGVEIKGEGDSPSRLKLQGYAYGRVADRIWLLCCPSLAEKCWKQRPDGWGRLEVFEGRVRAYNCATRFAGKIKVPHGWRHTYEQDNSRYEPEQPRRQHWLSSAAICGTLWKDELLEVAKACGLPHPSTATVGVLTQALCESVPVTVLHSQMIIQLRKRVWRNKDVIDTRAGTGS